MLNRYLLLTVIQWAGSQPQDYDYRFIIEKFKEFENTMQWQCVHKITSKC